LVGVIKTVLLEKGSVIYGGVNITSITASGVYTGTPCKKM
jgi:hypothetical protein